MCVFGAMDGKRFVVCCLHLEILVWMLLAFVVQLSDEANPGDVAAINNLYASLGSPSLPGWGAVGGDPCNGLWQGVECENGSILTIQLNAANLGGELGDNLGSFSSLRTLDLSNNHIGGSIPTNLPVTLLHIFLSANAFTGSIPTSLSYLSRLSAMSLNGNHLTGEIPDSFEGLTALVNLDLSSNNLSGSLPPSVESLSSLTTLYLQNNQLSGTLDVLQDLPLKNLNVENNLFSGPIPQKLLAIPNFKKDGNLFNSSIAPSTPPTSSTAPPISGSPTSAQTPSSQSKPKTQTDGPSASAESSSTGKKKSLSVKRVIWISIAAVLSFIILVLAILLCLPKCLRKWHETQRTPKHHEIAPYIGARENPGDSGSLVQPGHDIEKAPLVVPPNEKQPRRPAPVPKPQDEQQVNVQTMTAVPKKDDSVINLGRLDIDLTPPPPPPPPPPTLPQERVIVEPIAPAKDTATRLPTRPLPLTSVKSYTIASLQQYTNSFSQDNLLGSGMLGSVYRVELPNGKLLAVKKLDKRVCDQQTDDEFLDLVNNIDRIRHANVVELMGYCAEHGQRLLVYEYCCNGTLQDALHCDDEFKRQLSWNTRMRMALGAARALEYLHEVCEPPIIHRNFKSANLLLDEELAVHVSDCGLASLISSGAVSQLSGQLLTTYGYGAPEFESGIYTSQSDVYSFGVVMLELITGRMSYDRTRSRGEQFLVRWAIPQLHDIDLLTRMVDPALDGKYPIKSLSHFADIISRCVQHEREFRPPMSEVAAVYTLGEPLSFPLVKGEQVSTVAMALILHSTNNNKNASKALIAAEYTGVKVEVPKDFQMGVSNNTPEFLKMNPIGKVPVLETPDGPVFESNAIARYVTKLKPNNPLFGSSLIEYSQIEQWNDFSATEVDANIGRWLYPRLGFRVYIPAAEEAAVAALKRALGALNTHLASNTYLVGHSITLADIIMVCNLSIGFRMIMTKSFTKEFPHVERYFWTVVNQPNFCKILREVKQAESIPAVQSKKPAQPEKPKAKEELKKEVKKEEPSPVEEEAAPKPKAKNPLDLLPPSKMILDDWKRLYSNTKTNFREVAVKGFWDMYDPEGYSLWFCDYKYNDENTVSFVTLNKVGGFLQRMDLVRKYAFGKMLIVGSEAPFKVQGLWLFRGKEIPMFVMEEVYDMELYEWKEVDINDEAQKERVSQMIEDHEPFEGEALLDAKCFK